MPTNPYAKPTLSGYNASPPPDDGTVSAANRVDYATIKTKLPDPLKTYIDTINDNVFTAFAKTINTDDAEANTLSGSLAYGSDELTIAAGVVTPNRSHHTIDTEADAATDNLDTINTGSVGDGTVLRLRAANGSRTVTVRDGVGNIQLKDNQDVDLEGGSALVLLLVGGTWYEEARPSRLETGTWTPVIRGTTAQGSNTYSTQDGTYVKIGSLVYCYFRVTITSLDVGMTGNAELAGLPFTVVNDAAKRGVANIGFHGNVNLTTAGAQLGGVPVAGSTTVWMLESADNIAALNLAAASITASSDIAGMIMFEV